MHILKSGYNQLKNIGIATLYEAQKNRLKNEINIQAKVNINLRLYSYLDLEIPTNIRPHIRASLPRQQKLKLN